MYDLVIIGGGPAGVAAGVYAARKRLKTLFVTYDWGGQSNVSEGIENWIGTIKISGIELGEALKAHLEAYKADIVDIKEYEKVTNIERHDDHLVVQTDAKGSYETKAVLIASGSHRRKLTVPGAERFDNKGVTYCASCDGPLYGGKDLVVIGGGNAALETAAQLLAYAKTVTLIQRGKEFRADPVTVKKVLSHPNMKAITNTEILEVTGEQFVTGVNYKDLASGKTITVPCEGVFVEIGLLPSTDFAKNVITLNQVGQIPIDPKTQRTTVDGIWAAGDCTDTLYHQNNIAAGDAVRALEDIYMYLKAR